MAAMHVVASIVWLPLALTACGAAQPAERTDQDAAKTPEQPSAEEPMHALSFEAVVQIPKEGQPAHPGKKFAGVFLEADDGTTWVATYRSDALWDTFAGRRVRVTGVRLTPQGQALSQPHLDVGAWELAAKTMDAPYLAVGAEQVIGGRFEKETWPDGTRRAGETETLFRSEDGTRYRLEHLPPELAKEGAARLRARVVEPSPAYTARPSGPWLWVLSREP